MRVAQDRGSIVREFVVERVSKGYLSGGDWMPVLNDVSLELERRTTCRLMRAGELHRNG
jgi:hypothetical protein